jgi:hypothetical protein
MSLFGVDKEVVELLREQVKSLETERDFWRDKCLDLKEKSEAKKVPALQEPQEMGQKEAKENPIEALALALAEGRGLQAPNKLTAWRAAKTAEHRREQVALSTGPLERIEG